MRMPHTQNHKLYFLHNNGKKSKRLPKAKQDIKKKKKNLYFPKLETAVF